ncbi:hypothetical protein [Leuconostoc citreum]|uniref:hypothetical protein n=1 Tax=Leuconostoc citreum TaxID=33964 RepID=UPI002072A67B|nr:hypothetical protein [Leuconostoc citreum]
MYVIYTDKKKNEQTSTNQNTSYYGFDSGHVVQEYLHYQKNLFNEKEFLIISPGYLSTTATTSNSLINNFFSYHQKASYAVMMLSGMNDSYVPFFYTSLQSTQQGSVYNNSPFKLPSHKDHRKMIFICTWNKPSDKTHEKSIDKGDIKNFLKDIDVHAVLIGSSNFSKTTYMGVNNIANKGEADIFMYKDMDSDGYTNSMEENEDFLVTKSTQQKKKSDSDILKDILGSTLEQALS